MKTHPEQTWSVNQGTLVPVEPLDPLRKEREGESWSKEEGEGGRELRAGSSDNSDALTASVDKKHELLTEVTWVFLCLQHSHHKVSLWV